MPQEWLAVNTVDFYNAVSMLYGTLAEFCTEKSCEVMSASSKYEYRECVLWCRELAVKREREMCVFWGDPIMITQTHATLSHTCSMGGRCEV